MVSLLPCAERQSLAETTTWAMGSMVTQIFLIGLFLMMLLGTGALLELGKDVYPTGCIAFACNSWYVTAVVNSSSTTTTIYKLTNVCQCTGNSMSILSPKV